MITSAVAGAAPPMISGWESGTECHELALGLFLPRGAEERSVPDNNSCSSG